MNTRRLVLVFLFTLVETTGYSQDREWARHAPEDPSQAVLQDVSTPDLRGSMRASLAFRLPEVNRPAGRGLLMGAPPLRPPSRQQGQKNWIDRHPKLFGSLVGFGVGCPIGAAQVGGSQDDFFNALDEFACPFLGGVGAGVGAAIGAAISR